MSQKALRMTPQRQIKFLSYGVQNSQPVEQYTPGPPMEQNVTMEEEPQTFEAADQKPAWMKKLQGVKKISNKEKRRRQNQNLRRLLTPKSALMVLNEIMPAEQLAFKVEAVHENPFNKKIETAFSAEVTVEGKTFKGVGETKASARQAAAELAIRDLIIARLNRLQDKDAVQSNGNSAYSGVAKLADATADGDENMETSEEEPMPMIQLASFALHKLFSEWEGSGHRVPHYKSAGAPLQATEGAGAPPTPAAPKQPAVRTILPESAAQMHPCMLLTYMRPLCAYRLLACVGDKPQNYEYKMAVDVDGATFMGSGKSKKEARKHTATAACNALFGVDFIQ